MESKVSPYDWTYPVTKPELFAGRVEELGMIEEKIRRLASEVKIPPSIAIVGERRVGKSSVLLRIEELCSRYSIATVKLTIDNKTGSEDWEFWHELIEVVPKIWTGC